MRTLLLGAAAAAALIVPAQASAQTNGYVDLSIGQTDIASEDIDNIGLGGAVAVDLSGNWRAQFDVDTTRSSVDGADFTTSSTAAHVYYEGPTWAVGGVLTSRDFVFGNEWSLGIEGQAHMGALVLEGGAAIGTLEGFGDEAGTTNLDASATWYVTPDFSVAAGASMLDIEDLGDEVTTYGIDGEYKFAGSAFSAFAGWSTSDVDSEDVDTWRIGGRYAFGDDTLQGRRSTGPRWSRGLGSLPFIS
ncbi:MAG: hypothetical protein K2P58_05430 [Hyphomonadaceae bacterium]|nr:hypothetical protein [Hyphomonadaceae bacterium]